MTASQLENTNVDPTHMRDAMCAVPTCVTVVAGDSNSTPAAMVVGSFVSISLEPALVGFFVVLDSTSWPVLREHTHLGISVLGESHIGMVSEITKKDPTRFDSTKWVTGPHREMLIRGAVTHMTGTIDSIQRVGDHDFVVLALDSINSEVPEQPLIFQNRRLQVVGA